MPTNTLTDSQCRSAKAGEKARKLFDGGGLHLYISPKGSKTWRLAYRFDGRPQTMSFGPYPEVSLAEARQRRDDAKAKLRDHINPIEHRKPSKQTNISLEDANESYWEGRKDISDGYRRNAQRGIQTHLCPTLGKLTLREIDRERLLTALNVMDASGHHVYVRKVRMWVGQVFEWAIEQGYAESNPCEQINPRKAFGHHRKQHFAALDAKDIPEFLARLSFESELTSVIACKLLALLWVRTKELRMMKWAQVEPGLWRLPASVMKSDEYHLVPLSKQAEALIEQMRQRSRGSEYVFPHETRLDRPMAIPMHTITSCNTAPVKAARPSVSWT